MPRSSRITVRINPGRAVGVDHVVAFSRRELASRGARTPENYGWSAIAEAVRSVALSDTTLGWWSVWIG